MGQYDTTSNLGDPSPGVLDLRKYSKGDQGVSRKTYNIKCTRCDTTYESSFPSEGCEHLCSDCSMAGHVPKSIRLKRHP